MYHPCRLSTDTVRVIIHDHCTRVMEPDLSTPVSALRSQLSRVKNAWAQCVVVLLRCLPRHRHARRPRIAEAEPALRTAVRGLVHSFRRKPKRDLIANVLYVYDMLRYTARNSSTKLCVLERAYKVPGQAQNNPTALQLSQTISHRSAEMPHRWGISAQRWGSLCGHYNYYNFTNRLCKSTLSFSCIVAPARLLPRRLMVFEVAQWCQAD